MRLLFRKEDMPEFAKNLPECGRPLQHWRKFIDGMMSDMCWQVFAHE